jgi:hypothetical protein
VKRPGIGWSFVSDSVQAHDIIMQTPLGQKLKEKGLCFIRRLTDATAYENIVDVEHENAVYNHWQKSWMTNDPAEAQAVAESQGLQVSWMEHPTDGLMMETRYYKSAFEYVPILDRVSGTRCWRVMTMMTITQK